MQTPPNQEWNRRVTDKIDPAVELAALRERVGHMTSTLDQVGRQIDRVVERVGDVASMRELAAQDRTTMSRIEASIANVTAQLGDQMSALRDEQRRRWDDHIGTHRALDRKMNFAIGWVSGVGVLGALLVGVVVWVADYRFTQVSAESAAVAPLRDKIHQIELHLARDRGQQFPKEGDPR